MVIIWFKYGFVTCVHLVKWMNTDENETTGLGFFHPGKTFTGDFSAY